MAKPKRIDIGGYVYHVMNRANGRLRIFKTPKDFEAFERILAEGLERVEMRICGYCIMGNHWHLLLWPKKDGDLSQYMHWVSLTHTQRFHTAHDTIGMGHLYRGRYKSFPVQDDLYYLTVLRYIEANPLRAKIVESAANWPWSSYAVRQLSLEKPFPLDPGPVRLPGNWSEMLDTISQQEKQQIVNSITRGAPFGSPAWTRQTADALSLQSTLKPLGRPRRLGKP